MKLVRCSDCDFRYTCNRRKKQKVRPVTTDEERREVNLINDMRINPWKYRD